MNAANAQLRLIDNPRPWRLDERTRAIGRKGVAQAREALRRGRRSRGQPPDADHDASPPRRRDGDPRTGRAAA
ncbi:MAG: hypothetical protein C0P77_002630 [Thermoanaerobacterales bacterium]|nr:hypothetical protein [Thermoanaerobacterales bacterium]